MSCKSAKLPKGSLNQNLPVSGQRDYSMKNLTLDTALLVVGLTAIIIISAVWLTQLFTINPII